MSFLIIFAVLALCVVGMAIGLVFGRPPIKHCGGAAIGPDGKRGTCSLCGNTSCPNQGKKKPESTEA